MNPNRENNNEMRSFSHAPQHLTLSDNALMSVVLLIFFLSGFSALTYQVVWVKMLSRTFG
jgi:hypothetical protein